MHQQFHASLIDNLQGKTSNPLRLAGNILDRFSDALRQYGCEHREELIATAKIVFDRLADLCPLPTQVEQAFWFVAVQPALNSLADSACGPRDNLTAADAVESDIRPLKFGEGA